MGYVFRLAFLDGSTRSYVCGERKSVNAVKRLFPTATEITVVR